MRSFDQFLAVLNEIPDPRRAEGKLYKLPYLLLFSVLAVITGGNSFRSIETFIKVHRRRLNAVFGLHWKRAPAHTAIRYILQGLDPREAAARNVRLRRDVAPAADQIVGDPDHIARQLIDLSRAGLTGIAVSLVKHAHHAFDLDRPGKDSWRHRQAGGGHRIACQGFQVGRQQRRTRQPCDRREHASSTRCAQSPRKRRGEIQTLPTSRFASTSGTRAA